VSLRTYVSGANPRIVTAIELAMETMSLWVIKSTPFLAVLAGGSRLAGK
jgi:hypothetical protein